MWNMDNVFPQDIPGLDVQNVIYNYTIRKQVQDQVDVTIQNENALGSGYIFRETDSWMPGSLDGTEINKAVPVIPNIPREYWGDGSIQVNGNGSITDAKVVYTYRVDPCYDQQFDPNCPGYKVPIPDIPEVDLSTIYGATRDSKISTLDENAKYKDKEEMPDEDKKKQDEEEEKDSKERLEKALAAANTAGMFADALAMSKMLDSMNLATNMNAYYSTSIPGGTYKETVVLADKQLPENRKGLRNGLAQQLMHEKMVSMQYQ